MSLRTVITSAWILMLAGLLTGCVGVPSRNDKPNNGLALCPNHHWAMDRNLIAPCPDPARTAPGIWKVSNRLDDRIEGQKDLLDLANRRVIDPRETVFYPAEESLRWREEHLSVKY